MEVAAINPFKYLVVTRVLATTFMIPLLVILADLIGIIGGYIGFNIHGDASFHLLTKVFDILTFQMCYRRLSKLSFGFFYWHRLL
jgi:phospholipid/cholesterol/gamma-HCH transport system permease protein